MKTLLALTALLSLSYPAFSLINQHLPAATPLYSPGQWILALAWPALGNRLALRRPRSLLWLLVFNLIIFLPAAATFLTASFAAGYWPAILPPIMELALIWIPTAAIAVQHPEEEDLHRLWESGLVVAALVALGREISRSAIPFFQAAMFVYLAAGVGLRALAAAAAASVPDPDDRRASLPLTVSLGVLLLAALFGLLAGGRRLAAGMLAALQAIWDFLRLLAHYLAILVDRLGLNRVPGQAVQRPKIPGAPPPVDLGPGLESAPLWFMIPLWIITIVLVVITLWMLIRTLFENIAAWRREMAASIVPARRRLRRPDFRRIFRALASFLRFVANRLKRWHRRRHPRDLAVLYDAFVRWGGRNRRPRRSWETPGAYLRRLQPEVAAACPELFPALRDLTQRYETYCYGQSGDAGLVAEERTLVRRLRRSRLHQRSLFSRLSIWIRKLKAVIVAALGIAVIH